MVLLTHVVVLFSLAGISRTDVGMVEPSMTRTDQTDSGQTDLLPTRTYVVPGMETTEDIEPTDATDAFTPPTKVSFNEHLMQGVRTIVCNKTHLFSRISKVQGASCWMISIH